MPPLPDNESALRKLNILDTQLHGFGNTHARAVKQAGEQSIHAVKMLEQRQHFFARQYHRQALYLFGTAKFRHPRQVYFEPMAACRQALEAPMPDQAIVESVQAFMQRVAHIDVGRCPCCDSGRLHIVGMIAPKRMEMVARGPP